jgi:diadenosine tetraphosphate (Ap4A) HIT family hydrolase
MSKGMQCAFCELQEIRDRTILETDLVRVFPTNIPIVPGHIIIIPIRHVEKVDAVTSEEWTALREVLEKIKRVLTKAFAAEGFNVAWNEGVVAGQSVPHFHIHLLPRKEGDAGITEYEPRKFLYRPGSRATAPEEELIQIAEEVKKYLHD